MILFEIIRKNAETEFGKEHNFGSIRSIEDFRRNLPLSDYEDYVEYVERTKRGEANLLTADGVHLLEPTGGSSAGSKLIPYTGGLEDEYKRGVYPWLADLYLHRPYLLNGKAYWAITPSGDLPEKREGSIPIGFKEDTEYLGVIGRLVEKAMAVPSKLARVPDIDEFLYASALFLLRERNLTLISVWSPTFLLTIIEKIYLRWDKLLREIESGSIASYNLRRFPSRMRELRGVRNGDSIDFSRVWRKLRLVSCWTDGPSRLFAGKIQKEFPGIEIQGKGLLATEGIVSFPLTGFVDPILSFRSHFYEFLDSANGKVFNAGEVRRGERYSVVITTSGGLYRYRLRDIVEVTGMLKGVPLMRFCGKEDLVSDFFGEKLNEIFVREAIESIMAELKIQPGFLLFAPCTRQKRNYCLLLQAEIDSRTKRTIERKLDKKLRENFHYNYARDLRQLENVEVKLIDRTKDAMSIYTEFLLKQGKKLGVIKPFLFYNREGIEQLFPDLGATQQCGYYQNSKRN
jgi:hypothetical protein